MLDLALLQRFCSPNELLQPQLAKPFNSHGSSWASNGYALIRLDTPLPDLEESTLDFRKSIAGAFQPALDFDWSTVKTDSFRCAHCGGTCWHVTCSKCGGDGTITCRECEEERDCPACRCTGTMPATQASPHPVKACTHCEADGHVHRATAMDVGSQIIDARILKWIAPLPGIQLFNNVEPLQPLRFTFTGGDGVIMPMRKPAVHHFEPTTPKAA